MRKLSKIFITNFEVIKMNIFDDDKVVLISKMIEIEYLWLYTKRTVNSTYTEYGKELVSCLN